MDNEKENRCEQKRKSYQLCSSEKSPPRLPAKISCAKENSDVSKFHASASDKKGQQNTTKKVKDSPVNVEDGKLKIAPLGIKHLNPRVPLNPYYFEDTPPRKPVIPFALSIIPNKNEPVDVIKAFGNDYRFLPRPLTPPDLDSLVPAEDVEKTNEFVTCEHFESPNTNTRSPVSRSIGNSSLHFTPDSSATLVQLTTPDAQKNFKQLQISRACNTSSFPQTMETRAVIKEKELAVRELQKYLSLETCTSTKRLNEEPGYSTYSVKPDESHKTSSASIIDSNTISRSIGNSSLHFTLDSKKGVHNSIASSDFTKMVNGDKLLVSKTVANLKTFCAGKPTTFDCKSTSSCITNPIITSPSKALLASSKTLKTSGKFLQPPITESVSRNANNALVASSHPSESTVSLFPDNSTVLTERSINVQKEVQTRSSRTIVKLFSPDSPKKFNLFQTSKPSFRNWKLWRK